MPPPGREQALRVQEDNPLQSAYLLKTSSGGTTLIVAPPTGFKVRIRYWMISSAATSEIVDATITYTRNGVAGGAAGTLGGLSTAAQVGCVCTEPGYVDCDESTVVTVSLSSTVGPGVHFTVHYEIVPTNA